MNRWVLAAVGAFVLAGPAAEAADFRPPSVEALETQAEASLPPPGDPDGASIDIGAAVDAAFAAADTFPAERYEAAALAKTLGGDPAAAFAWVRDHIRLDLYPGALRAPDAVLAAGGANALDRARLLKTLFDAMGIAARYATGTLDETQAAALNAGLFKSRAAGAPLDASAAFNSGFLDRIRARAGRDAGILTRALGGVAGPGAAVAAKAGDLHVWVQADIGGTWMDFDTSLPDAAIGAPLVPAAATPDALDEAQNQTVTFIVTATTGAGAQTLMTSRLNAADAAASQILLYFEPAEGGLGGAITGGGGYRPVLLVDGEATKGEAIASSDGGGGGLGGAIGMLGGGEEENPLLSLTLKIVTEAPGAEPVEATRVLAAAGPEGAMASDADGLIATRWLHHIIVSNGGRSPREFAILKGAAIDYAARTLASEESVGAEMLPSIAWPTTSANLALPTASERLFIEALNDSATRAYVARPRVFIASTGPLAGGEGGARQGFALDLALDDVAVVPAFGNDVAPARLWYGVLEAALETEYGLLRLGAMDTDGRAAEGASLALGTAAPTVIGPGVDLGDAPAALKADLAGGARVVVAGDPQTAKVWWTIRGDGLARAALAPSLGGLTGGGGYHSGGPYTNASGGGPRYIIDPNTGNTVGEVRNGRDMMYRTGARSGSSCRGGNEYSTILGCVSIPTSLAVGVLGAVIVITYGYVAVTIIRAL